MTSDSQARIPTGVPGLDEVLFGGFLPNGFYLVQGDPGSGKTTLALQYLIGRREAGESCLYITLTETRRDLEHTCLTHGWKLDGITVCDLSQSAANLAGEPESSVFHPSETELGETTTAIFEAVDASKPRHVVFDGLSEMRLLSGQPLIYRRQLLALKEFFGSRGATVVLLDDCSAPFGSLLPESVVGGNIVLDTSIPEYGRARRRLRVTKVRGSNFREGYHDVELRRGGLLVHPRLVAAEHHDAVESTTISSGIAGLDAMLKGGFASGSTALLLGPAGVGKSTVAMQFVVNALKDGQKAAVYMFDEILPTLFERVEKLCLAKDGGLQSYIEERLLHAQQIDSAEMSPGAFAHEVRRVVDEGARIVVIDSLNGYINAMPEERFLAAHLHEMFAYLNQKGVLTILVAAQHGMLVGSSSGAAGMDISYLADSVVLFRYFEAHGEIRQAISAFKKRTGPHERTLRQLRVTSQGLEVGEPLREFRGIMSGVPEYAGSTPMIGSPPES